MRCQTTPRPCAKAIPDQMAGFAQLGDATYKDGALSPKQKELIALAIGITVRCDGCVAYPRARL